MSCIQANRKGVNVPYPHPLAFTVTASGGPVFFLSDNPEHLAHLPVLGQVLWNYTVAEPSSSEYKIRAFLWHDNHSLAPVHIGLTIQNLSTNDGDDLVVLKAATTREFDVSTTDFFVPGKCIAKATLDNTQETWLPDDIPIPHGGPAIPPVVIETFSLTADQNQHLFACYELTVQRKDGVAGNMNFILRSAWDPSDITVQTSPPPDVDNGDHPAVPAKMAASCLDLWGNGRGTWPYSRIGIAMSQPYMYGNVFGVLALGGRIGQCCAPPDTAMFRASNALPPNSVTDVVANKGMYGVDYNPIVVQASNPTGFSVTVDVYIGTTIDGLCGALGLNGTTYGVPDLDRLRPFVPLFPFDPGTHRIRDLIG